MNPVDQIRQTFGLPSDAAVANLCARKKQTVSEWRAKAKIPANVLIDLQRRAVREGRALTPILDPHVAYEPQAGEAA